MPSRERVVAAMDLTHADRVPFMCQLSMGHYLIHLGLDPVAYWTQTEVLADAFIALARRYDFDGILINLPGRHPDADKWIDRVERGDDKDVIHYKSGGQCVCPHDDLAMHVEPAKLTLDDLDPDQLYYEDPHTLGGLKTPPFHYDLEPDGEHFPEHIFGTIDRVVEQAGEEFSVHSEVFSPFTQFMERLSYENGLMALMDDPGKCKAILKRFAAGAADLATRQAGRGVDAVLMSSAFAGGGFISRGFYEEFVLPYEKQVHDAIRAAGVKCYVHTCGNIGDRLELMQATGIDGLDTMDPPPLGDTILRDAKPRIGRDVFLKGNVDSVNILLHGTVEQVRGDAREKLDSAMAGGGYILSSACSVAPRVPAEHIMAMGEVVAEYGQY